MSELLDEVSALVRLDVVAVEAVPWPRWGRVWVLRLRDGRVVSLGHDRFVRTPRHLTSTLGPLGGRKRWTPASAHRLLCLFARLREVAA